MFPVVKCYGLCAFGIFWHPEFGCNNLQHVKIQTNKSELVLFKDVCKQEERMVATQIMQTLVRGVQSMSYF